MLMRINHDPVRTHRSAALGNATIDHHFAVNARAVNRNKGPRRQPEKNVFTDEQIEKLEEIFHSSMFNYQRHWWEAGKTNRIRNLLKSRQIGATFYFAREA